MFFQKPESSRLLPALQYRISALAVGLFGILLSTAALAGELFTQLPEQAQADEKYVFYSHGFIVEGDNETPKHPHFGVYDFPAIKQALAASDFNLIAYHRKAGTVPSEFAQKLANDVKELTAQGVPLRNISLMGFSRGGMITILVSDLLAAPDINVVLLASCSNWVSSQPKLELAGNVLSVYETSDRFGSCRELVNQSDNVSSFTEIAISTGKEHGAFFKPLDEWVVPVVNWINSRP